MALVASKHEGNGLPGLGTEAVEREELGGVGRAAFRGGLAWRGGYGATSASVSGAMPASLLASSGVSPYRTASVSGAV